MKIAQIVNIWQSVPPVGYGGTERVVYDLCQGLLKKGHQLTLFASGDSQIKNNLSYVFEERLLAKHVNWSKYLYPLLHFTYVHDQIKKAGDYDIIHGHYSLASDLISLSLAHLQNIPAVFTLHCPLKNVNNQHYEDRKKIFEYCKNICYASISNNQRTLSLPYVATVYHGINASLFPFSDSTDNDYILWLGRIVPEKGLGAAFQLIEKLNKKLVIAGRVDQESEVNYQYFQTEIKDKLNNSSITYVSEVDSGKRNELMSKSKLFFFPIQWEEPFGLVMIEAMACGAPVVAYARGSVPEVIKDGETGFIVNSSDDDIRGDWIIKKTGIEGLCEAVERIYSMSESEYGQMRRNCRLHVEKNFTVERMVDEYEKLYKGILK